MTRLERVMQIRYKTAFQKEETEKEKGSEEHVHITNRMGERQNATVRVRERERGIGKTAVFSTVSNGDPGGSMADRA